jgi:uncharacterized membrane protein YdbT with pleckstrin-like domain
MSKEIKYLMTTLGTEEQILKIAELHWWRYICPVFLLILGLSCFAIGADDAEAGTSLFGVLFLIFGFIGLLRVNKMEFVITNKRVIAKTGIIAVKTGELRNLKVESVRLDQSIFGRIFGFSDIVFSGTGSSSVRFKDITNPVLTKTQFEEIIEKNQ